MTITRAALRAEMYNQIPGLGFTGTADAFGNTTLTDTFNFQDTTLAPNAYRGFYIYRPSFSTDDMLKKATTLVNTTGVISHGGFNYSNQDAGAYEIVGLLHPAELNSCLTRAMTRIFFETQVVLSGVGPHGITDGDMETAGVGSWTASSGSITLSKSTTAANIYSGTQSLSMSGTVAGEYAESAEMAVQPNTWLYVSTVVRSNAGSRGTFSLSIKDIMNSNNILGTVTCAEVNWSHLWTRVLLPAGCTRIIVRLTLVSPAVISAIGYWDHVIAYPQDGQRYSAPAFVTEQFNFLKLREAVYNKVISSQATGGYDNALSRSWKDWLQPSMFSVDPFTIDANPYLINLTKPVPAAELWVEGKRPYSDIEPLTASDTSTTKAPPRLVYAYAKQELGMVLHKRYPSDKRWEVLIQEALMEVDAETRSRPEVPMMPINREVYNRI